VGTQWQDLPSTPDVVAVRDPIRRYDEVYLREAQKIFTNSQTVADRLRAFNGIEAEVCIRRSAIRSGSSGRSQRTISSTPVESLTQGVSPSVCPQVAG